jgi:hypothetical protein
VSFFNVDIPLAEKKSENSEQKKARRCTLTAGLQSGEISNCA